MDFIAFSLAFCVNYFIRFRSGLFETSFGTSYWIMAPAAATSTFWLLLFALMGRYRPLYGMSRFDSLVETVKSTGLGILFIFLAITLDALRLRNEPVLSMGNFTLLTYWALLVLFAGGGRVALRTVQHILIMKGIALSPALIVGFNERGKALLDQTLRFPAMGFSVAGYVDDKVTEGEYRGVKVLGKIKDLGGLITEWGALEVLIALRRDQEASTEKVIGTCGQLRVGIKVMPELYHLVSGQVKTQGIYGLPLVEVFPHLMKPWQWTLKRLMDVSVSLTVLLLNLPVMLVTALAIKLDSRGPVIYKQKRVGRYGKEFTIYKLRSMVQDAEKRTGVKWAEKDDPRVTGVGKFLRVSRLDEVPQFFNVLIGNMSLVGPRPERKFFVEQFGKQIPLYNRRHNVKPGITGWGQLRGKYDASLEDVKIRLSRDLFYIDNMSVSLDLKILVRTLFLVIRLTGQ